MAHSVERVVGEQCVLAPWKNEYLEAEWREGGVRGRGERGASGTDGVIGGREGGGLEGDVGL